MEKKHKEELLDKHSPILNINDDVALGQKATSYFARQKDTGVPDK